MGNARAWLVGLASVVLLVLSAAGVGQLTIGCGGDTGAVTENPDSGTLGGAPCTAAASACGQSNECCSGACDPVAKTCANGVSRCAGPNDACQNSTDCCSLSCANGKCGTAACTSDN